MQSAEVYTGTSAIVSKRLNARETRLSAGFSAEINTRDGAGVSTRISAESVQRQCRSQCGASAGISAGVSTGINAEEINAGISAGVSATISAEASTESRFVAFHKWGPRIVFMHLWGWVWGANIHTVGTQEFHTKFDCNFFR